MVFESVLSNLLNTYLNEFIDDLSANQLKVGAFSGNVELNNLAIKGNALDSLNLPFRVVYGHIGKFTAKIPWVSLYTSPVVFNIQKVYILCVPNVDSKYDEEAERKQFEADKKKQLLSIEEAWKTADLKDKGIEEKTSDDFVSKLVAQIAKNLEIRLEDVHICYEDKFTKPKCPFSLGLTLKRLTFVTLDNPTPKYEATNKENCFEKHVSLQFLSVYWNCSKDLSLMSAVCDGDLPSTFQSLIACENKSPQLSYILRPSNFTAKTWINRKPVEDDYLLPMFDIEMFLDQFNLTLNRGQIQSAYLLLDSLDRMKLAGPYRKWRPNQPIMENPSAWWRFVITSILETQIRQKNRVWSWSYIKAHRKLLKEYKEVYMNFLKSGRKTGQHVVDELERRLDVFNIVLMRSRAKVDLDKIIARQESEKSERGGWFSWIYGGSSKKQDTQDGESGAILDELKKEMTADEKKKLYQAIGYEESVPAEYPESYEAYLVKIILLKINVSVHDESISNDLVCFVLDNVSTQLGYRPTSAGARVKLDVHDIDFKGQGGSELIINKTPEDALLELEAETNPLTKEFDYGVSIKTRGIDFVCHTPTLYSLLDVLTPDEDLSLNQIQALAQIKLDQFKMMSVSGLEYAIEKHPRLKIDIIIKPTYIIVPDHGCLTGCNDVLILSAGEMRISSSPTQQQEAPNVRLKYQHSGEDELMKAMRENAYEKFKLSISRTQLILTSGNEWQGDLNSAKIEKDVTSTSHLIQPFGLDLNLMRSVVADDPEIPRMRVEGEVPPIFFRARNFQLCRLANLLLNIPKPDKGETLIVPEATFESQEVNQAKAETDALKIAHETAETLAEQEKPAFQVTNLVMNFSIEGLFCDLRMDDDRELLKFCVQKLGTEVQMKTFDILADLYLGSILVEVRDLDSPASTSFKILETPKSMNLLQIKYQLINKNGPTFSGVVQNIELIIAQIRLSIDSPILDELLIYSQKILDSLPSTTQTDRAHASRRLSISSQVSASLIQTITAKPKNRSASEEAEKILNLKTLVRMDSVVLSIGGICSTTLDGLEANLSLFESGVIVAKAQWNDFKVVNCVEDATTSVQKSRKLVHPTIIESQSERVLEMEVVVYTPEVARTIPGKVDVKCCVHFGRLRIVFLNEFVSRLVNFLTVFENAKQRALAASSRAASLAKQTAVNAFESATRIGLDIVLEAPVIIVPRNWESTTCLSIDLGQIVIRNVIKRIQTSLIDQIKCELSNFKVSASDLQSEQSTDTQDDLIHPISFILEADRNLTFETNKKKPEIELKATLNNIQLSISQFNLMLLMSILSENLAEVAEPPSPVVTANEISQDNLTLSVSGRDEKPKKKEKSRKLQKVTASSLELSPSVSSSRIVEEAEVHVDAPAPKEPKAAEVFIRYLLSFSMPKVDLVLYQAEKKTDVNRLTRAYLAGFDIYCRVMTNDSINASVTLSDIVLEDERRSKKRKLFKRLMFCNEYIKSSNSDESKTMRLEFVKEKDTKVDVEMSGFTLIFALDYLMQISEMLTASVAGLPKTTKLDYRPKVSKIKEIAKSSKNFVSDHSMPSPVDSPLMTFSFKMSQGDIILIESAERANPPAIVFNSLMNIDVKMKDDVINLGGSIRQIQLGMTNLQSYQEKRQVENYIVTPFRINILGEMTGSHSQHINIEFISQHKSHSHDHSPDIGLIISPNTVQVVLSILSALGQKGEEEKSESDEDEHKLETDLFTPKPIGDWKKWGFLMSGISEAVEATEDMFLVPETNDEKPFILQQLVVTMESVSVTVESGGTDSRPLIKLFSSHVVILENWKKLKLRTSCFMEYRNEKTFAWEPIIETINGRPWDFELTAKVLQDKESGSKITASLESKDQLELCMSKSAVDVISGLGQSFKNAYKQPDTPLLGKNLFEFSNFTGMDLKIEVDVQKFSRTSHEQMCLLPTDQTKLSIEIKQGETVTLNKIRESSNENENQIVCTLSHLNHTITRRLCLRGNERRCFLFPCMSQPGEEYKWIFDLSQQDSRCKKVIFGTNVSVTNHFDVPLRLYHITSGGLDELTFLHEVKPGDTYFLPVDIIFVRNKYQCIFVKPSDDYCTPGEAITWGPDLQKVLSFATIKCESKKREPNFYIRIKRETQVMVFEDSSKVSSDCRYYKFHLYPVMRLRNLLPMKIEMTTILSEPENISRTATIVPGQANNVYHLDLEKNHKIVLKIPEYLDQEWICENRIPHSKWHNKDGESVTWTFTSRKGKTLDLAINFNVKEEGCRVASLFAPFWMINKTGKKLIYKMGDSLIEHPPSIDVPILLCFRGKTSSSKKKLSLAIDKSEFSDAFSIDAAGNRGNIIVRGGGHNYCASVETELSEFRLTNIVKFSPFYSVINKSSMDIEVSEDNKSWISVGSKSSRSLWPDTQGLCQIFFRLPSNTSQPSEPITLKEHNSTLLRVGDRLIVVNVDITENSVVIQLTNYFPGSAPVRIFNTLEKTSVHFGQNLVSIRKRVPPLHSAYFAWYDPSKNPLNLIWSTAESGEMVVDLLSDSVGTTNEGGLHYACFMYGQQRILLITRDHALAQATTQQAEFIKPYFDLELTSKGIGVSLVDDELKKEVAYIGITSSEVLWEVRKERSKRFKPFSVKQIEALENIFQKTKQRDEISGVLLIPKTENKPNIVTVENLKVDLTDPEKMKLLEPYSGTLRRNAASGVWLAVSLSPHVIQFHMKVHRVQVDNQMDGCVFPIVMCPVSPPRSLTLDRAPKAFFEISTIVQMQMNMLRFNFIQLLIQELLIQIDGDFLMSLLEFTSFAKPANESFEKRLQKSLKRALEDTTDYTETPVSSKNYFDSIHFSPIKAHVSFNLGDAEIIQFIPVIDFLLRSAGVTLTEFREVLFKIDYFERKNVLYSYPELVYSAIQHYMRQVLKQFYVIVLGLDVIGNPVGLVLGLKQGVGDLFYEPIMGMVEGPEEFAEGLALGVRSLVSHTVGGAAGALGKITGTLGDGISTLTMDQESRRKRRERINRKPTFAESGANLFRGLATGITGVVTKPVKGAQKEGFEGLVKGFGRGVVGIVADPVTGAMDFASGSLNALQRVVDVNTATKRQRPTRHFHSDGILRSFNMHEAIGRSILRDVEKGRFATDHYQAHFNLTPESVFMITDNRILSLKQGCISKSLDLDWHETIDNIESIQTIDHTQVLIRLACAKRKMGGLLSSEKQRTVICPKPEIAKLVVNRIFEVKRSGAVLSPTSSSSTLSLVSCTASEAKEDQHF